MLQDEYYVIESNNDSCILSWDQTRGQLGTGKPIMMTDPIKVRLGEPIPDSPVLVDYHEMPGPVISKTIFDVLAPLDIYGIQLIPAEVRNPKTPLEDPHNYWFMHVWNRISCLDKEKSEIRTNRSGSRIFAIDKLVLDEQTLELFELHKRLIFELSEKTSIFLVHQSIKDRLLSIKPVGCRFFKAGEWQSDSAFS